MSVDTDYRGHKYSHLTLLSYSRPGGRGVGAFWKARCDCGAVVDVLVKEVRAGRRRTCGECEFHRNLISSRQRPPRHLPVRLRRAYGYLLRRSLAEGAEWGLKPVEFQRLVQSSCLTCGSSEPGRLQSVVRLSTGEGYTPDNCAALCTTCNRLRGSRNLVDFLGIVTRIANYVRNRVNEQHQG